MSNELSAEQIAEMAEAIERDRIEREERESAEERAREEAEAAERERIAAEREEIEAQDAARAMAALQAEAEAENQLLDSLAALTGQPTEPTPLPVIAQDLVEAPHGSFGPTLGAELQAAGLSSVPIVRTTEHVIFAADISPADRAAVMIVIEAHDPTASDMPQQRQAAFETAMAFGNRITDQVERKWSNIERASFTAQEIEAKAIVAGQTMPDDAMLPTLAAHKGISALDYAQQVLDNAATYRQLAIAAVILRRGADGLLDAAIDTPEKLSAAMDQLRQQAAQFCEQFGLSIT